MWISEMLETVDKLDIEPAIDGDTVVQLKL